MHPIEFLWKDEPREFGRVSPPNPLYVCAAEALGSNGGKSFPTLAYGVGKSSVLRGPLALSFRANPIVFSQLDQNWPAELSQTLHRIWLSGCVVPTCIAKT
jgi:hypothetical protein